MAFLPIASIVLGAALWDAPSAAVFVEGSAATPVIADGISSTLEDGGARVLSRAEIDATLKWRGRTASLDDGDLAAFREELGVDRLVHLSLKRSESEIAVLLRVADADLAKGVAIRALGSAADAEGVVTLVRALLERIPPLPRGAVDLTGKKEPKILRSRRPELPRYPPFGTPKRALIVMEILVDERGVVADVRAIEGNAVYVEAMTTALWACRFEPLVVDGQPRSWRSRVDITMRAEGSADPNARFLGKGDHEVGIETAIESGDVYLSFANQREHSQSRNAVLKATGGFFGADDIEAFATIFLAYPMAQSKLDGQGGGLGLGAAWLPQVVPGAHAGPIASAGYSWREGHRTHPGGGKTFFEGEGVFVSVGISARTRVRPGIGFGFTVGGYYESFGVGESGSTTGGGRGTELGFRIGLSLASTR